ncbi:tRNA (adenosine(37)-N6)-threonylcarbamoyltransferase complex dimerization subunit type 1 TsaB [Anaerophilus nitritogenes]|uniref:tRNA (adenosine(37)-N6)-threonylcarbamoyltransferase complex dimerization subunit type 1 TsaB n=1 Tax=Anaerophilus nitritogenes TaxID=2498136 RepID=UPI00101B94D3|nr:tRNA (adenosine(37)-N6)-threonylcarbamoyltransferase complex dimerization subunit type 1 TsaB [Anaerophilus nitritogenes]
MKILSFDTSSMVATIALIEDEKLIGEYIINHKRTHSQKLMPMIDELLKSCEVKIEEIDKIAVAKGPGSFTGIRIGIATAKGLAHALDIPVVGISTLDGLAFNLYNSNGLICPILDARRSQVYTAIYKWDNLNLNRIEEPIAVSIQKLCEILLKRPEPVIFLGDGVQSNKEYLLEVLKERAIFAPNSHNITKASSIGQLAMKSSEDENFYELVPTYLRKSEAERQYEEKQKRCEENEQCKC